MPDTPSSTLASIEVTSLVSSSDHKPYCHIKAFAGNGRILMGQMAPDEVRGLALQWLEVAAAAEQDALVYAELAGNVPDEGIALLLTNLRARRGHQDLT